MGTGVRPAKTSPGPWDAFADVDGFVDDVLVELAAMEKDGTRAQRSGPKPPLAGAALRKAVMAIWCVCFCGMQWRAIGVLSDIPFSTLYGLFARWTRLGLWRRLLDRQRRTWRRACGDAPEPSAVVIDSRSCRSAPSCFARGIDGGKKVRGVKIQMAVEKYGIPLAIDVAPANQHDTKAIVPVLRELADGGFQGSALGDLGYRGSRLAEAGQALGITVAAIARGRGRTIRSRRYLLGSGTVLCLVKPLPAVEHHRRALEGSPHRFRCDRLHFHPLSATKASCRRGSLRLTSTNRHSACPGTPW
jgi:transposase